MCQDSQMDFTTMRPRAVTLLALVAGTLALAAVGASDTRAQATAAKSCDKRVANIKVYAVSAMTCAAATRDIGRSLNTCCQARFRSSGGFSCTTTLGGDGRCTRKGRSYRFNVYE